MALAAKALAGALALAVAFVVMLDAPPLDLAVGAASRETVVIKRNRYKSVTLFRVTECNRSRTQVQPKVAGYPCRRARDA